MGRKKLSTSEKIRRYVQRNPEAKPAEVAVAIGCKASLVYVVKNTMKKQAQLAETNNVSPAETDGVDIDAAHKKNRPITIAEMAVQMFEEPHDPVTNPAHYTAGGIETIDFIAAKLTKEEFIGYLKGNALKYGSRIGKKGDADVDAGKMLWYAAKLREALSPTL